MRAQAARAGLALGVLHASAADPLAHFNGLERSPLWRLLGQHVRTIGYVQEHDTLTRDPTQTVSESVEMRYRALPSYRPENLIAFRERDRTRGAQPRAEAEPGRSSQTRA